MIGLMKDEGTVLLGVVPMHLCGGGICTCPHVTGDTEHQAVATAHDQHVHLRGSFVLEVYVEAS